MNTTSIDSLIEMVLRAQRQAHDQGLFAVWTVYKRPLDWPDGYIARMHISGSSGTSPTDLGLKTVSTSEQELDLLRFILRKSGLSCLDRDDGDEPQILESWI